MRAFFERIAECLRKCPTVDDFVVNLGVIFLNIAGIGAIGAQAYLIYSGFLHFIPWGKKSLKTEGIIVDVLHGIELWILAPIPYLLIRVATKYLQDFKLNNSISQGTLHDMMAIKTIIAGIFIGVLASDLVGDFLEDSSEPDIIGKYSLWIIGLKILSIATLAGYIGIIERPRTER